MMFPSTDNKHKVQTPPVQLMRTNFTPELQQHTDWTDVVTQLLSLPLHEPHSTTLEGDYCSCWSLLRNNFHSVPHFVCVDVSWR